MTTPRSDTLALILAAGLVVAGALWAGPLTPDTAAKAVGTRPTAAATAQTQSGAQSGAQSDLSAVPAPTPEPEPDPSEALPAAPTWRLVIPSVGLDVPLTGAIAPDEDGVIDPPERGAATPVIGISADQQATVIAMHSTVDGGLPGNLLQDGLDGGPAVHVGDTMDVDGVEATVTWVGVTPKDQLPPEFWTALEDPAAIILITCRSEAASAWHSTSNVVVVARVEGA
jgi:hypothetical protein